MGKAKLEKRSKIKPFLKVVNFNHIMPTRSVVLTNLFVIDIFEVVNSIGSSPIEDSEKYQCTFHDALFESCTPSKCILH